jgi:hypothetical protein
MTLDNDPEALLALNPALIVIRAMSLGEETLDQLHAFTENLSHLVNAARGSTRNPTPRTAAIANVKEDPDESRAHDRSSASLPASSVSPHPTNQTRGGPTSSGIRDRRSMNVTPASPLTPSEPSRSDSEIGEEIKARASSSKSRDRNTEESARAHKKRKTITRKRRSRRSKGLTDVFEIGTKVRKYFDGHGEFVGKVIDFDESTRLYKIRYSDDDVEEVRGVQVYQYAAFHDATTLKAGEIHKSGLYYVAKSDESVLTIAEKLGCDVERLVSCNSNRLSRKGAILRKSSKVKGKTIVVLP